MPAIVYFLLIFSISINVFAYESENKLQAVIIGKVAKYIHWTTPEEETFTITVLNNQFGSLFDEVYEGKRIKNRVVRVQYIHNIEELHTTDILFISQADRYKIDEILEYLQGKNILTVSNIRGFAQKGGCLQLSFFEQNLKLKMNTECMHKKGLKVNNALLRVVEIVKSER